MAAYAVATHHGQARPQRPRQSRRTCERRQLAGDVMMEQQETPITPATPTQPEDRWPDPVPENQQLPRNDPSRGGNHQLRWCGGGEYHQR